MKVKDVLALAAANLGREDLAAAVYESSSPTGELSSLLRCYNLVENEIALDYFPLKAEQKFNVENGEIPYADFRFAPVSVSEVKGASPIAFELYPSCLKVEAESGEVTVKFTYTPVQKEWEDDSEFTGKISARLLSFGVASEFCLTSGMYAEAATWEKKYREALRASAIVRKRLSVRSRRWI